jgi:predicted small secreted protein
MKTTKLLFLAALLSSLSLAACEQQGPFEEAGERIDEASEDAGNAIEDACEDAKDALGAEDKDC